MCVPVQVRERESKREREVIRNMMETGDKGIELKRLILQQVLKIVFELE